MTGNDANKESRTTNMKVEALQRVHDEMTNPCIEESYKSMECIGMSEDKRMCTLHIENYKACVKFWNHIKKQRRKAGILPHLPLPEERPQIRKEFFEKLKPPTHRQQTL